VPAAVGLSPRVEISQRADLSTVMTYLVERARDEVRGRVRGTRRAGNAQAASWRLRSIRVPSGRHFELVIIGPLDRFAESLPAVTQPGDGLGSAGEDRVMGEVRGRPAAGHGARPAQDVNVAQAGGHRPYVPVQPGDGGHRDRGWLRDLEVGHPFARSERVRCPALVPPANAPGHRKWLPEELIIGQAPAGAGKGEELDLVHQLQQRIGSFPGHEPHRSQPLRSCLGAAKHRGRYPASPTVPNVTKTGLVLQHQRKQLMRFMQRSAAGTERTPDDLSIAQSTRSISVDCAIDRFAFHPGR
jgi:hypothetical protein